VQSPNVVPREVVTSLMSAIRSPLHNVVGLSDLLQDARLETSAQRLLGAALASAQDILRLCEEVRQFTDLQTGAYQPLSAEASLRELVEQCAASARADALMKDVEVRVDVQSSFPDQVLVDDHALVTVLGILLDNAVRATDDGYVAVRLRQHGGGASALRLEVRDSGGGVPAEHVDDAFVPFALRARCASQYPGFGLGLARAHGLVVAMGGTIELDPTATGTKVVVDIPFGALARGRALEAVGIEAVHDRPEDHHILLVEDNEINRIVTLRQLSRLGYVAHAVADGRAGVAEAMTGRYSVVLMDFRMPGMSGEQATREIRAAEKALTSRVPIVALTASASLDDRDACLIAGMDDYIAKPVDLATLADVLRRWTRTSVEQTLPTLDTNVLGALQVELDGDASALASALEAYVDELSARRMRIFAAHRRGDAAALQVGAACLRAASSSIGASTLARTAAAIEWAADTGADPAAAIDRLRTECSDVTRAVADYLAARGAASRS